MPFTKQADRVACAHCGAHVLNGRRFCSVCGAAVLDSLSPRERVLSEENKELRELLGVAAGLLQLENVETSSDFKERLQRLQTAANSRRKDQ